MSGSLWIRRGFNVAWLLPCGRPWIRRDDPAAYARLRQAEAIVRRLGAGPLLDEIADLATRARIPLAAHDAEAPVPAPGPPNQLGQLTTRELEVLEELADGLTNREIGRRLFISEKTVSAHVARIFAKIGVHTRVQASAVLRRVRRAG